MTVIGSQPPANNAIEALSVLNLLRCESPRVLRGQADISAITTGVNLKVAEVVNLVKSRWDGKSSEDMQKFADVA